MAFKAVWLIKKNPELTHEEYCAAHAGHAPTLMPYIGHLVTDYRLVFADFENKDGPGEWNGASIMTFPDRAAFEEVGRIIKDPKNAEATGEDRENFIDHEGVYSFYTSQVVEYDVSSHGAAENPEFQGEGPAMGAVWFANGLPGMEPEAFREAFDAHVRLVLGYLGSTVSDYKLTYPTKMFDNHKKEVPVAYACVTEMVWPSMAAYEACGQMASAPDVGPVIQADEKSFIDLPGVVALTGRCVKIR